MGSTLPGVHEDDRQLQASLFAPEALEAMDRSISREARDALRLGRPPIDRLNHLKQHREAYFKRLTDTQRDNDTLFANDATDSVRRYASGVMSPAYWKAYASIPNSAMCVPASELGEKTLARACRHAARGGTLLIDSGAFVYKSMPEQMPWDKVIRNYEQIADAASPSARLTFVLPDAVGNQDVGLEALKQFGRKVQAAIGPDHETLLPLQRGPRSPGEYARAAMEHLDTPPSGIALPMAQAAFPTADIAKLADLPGGIPKRIHLLGITSDTRKMAAYQDLIAQVPGWENADISADAVEFRKWLKKDTGILTLIREEVLLGPVTDALINTMDDTELSESYQAMAHDKVAQMHYRQPYERLDHDQQEIVATSDLTAFFMREAYMQDELKRLGPWATACATNALARGITPKLLHSYWHQIDAIEKPATSPNTERETMTTELPRNTKLRLAYRCASTTIHMDSVLPGRITDQQIQDISARAIDGYQIVAPQVQLTSPLENALDNREIEEYDEEDHPLTNLVDWEDGVPKAESLLTDETPTQIITVDDLVKQFNTVTWNQLQEMERLGLPDEIDLLDDSDDEEESLQLG